MPRFQFRLATLLRLREGTRDERRSLLAQAVEARQKLADQRAELENFAFQLRRSQQQQSQGAVNVDRLIDAHRYQLVLQSQLQVLERQETAIDAEVEKRREALVAADREVRVLEKLRETQRERFNQEAALVEGKQLDEIAARMARAEEAI